MTPDAWWSEIVKRAFVEGKPEALVAWEELSALQSKLVQAREVITAARKLNPWCLVTHRHIPGGWEELQAALAAIDAKEAS